MFSQEMKKPENIAYFAKAKKGSNLKNLDFTIRLMVNLRLFPLYYTVFLLICGLCFFAFYLADN